MAWRLNTAVVRGEIDNRTKGTVTGKIWLIDQDNPIELQLQGDCLRDMAGCLTTFENRTPDKGDEYTGLDPQQNGLVGDITASRKVRVFDVPLQDAIKMMHMDQKPPEHMGNCIYIEWFSEINGRVVIESTDYKTTVSPAEWKMSEDEENNRKNENKNAVFEWMKRMTGAASAAEKRKESDPTDEEEVWMLEEDTPMDEFAWEKFMKESDKHTDKLMELYEKYEGIEDEERERLIAREMGWDQIGKYLDQSDETDPDPGEWDMLDFEDIFDLDPDPLTEGIEWVRDDFGRPVHPLHWQCFQIISEFRKDCKKAGWLEEETISPLYELIFSAHMINVKLAGALNSIWLDHSDPGFIVACLKRSLKYFNETMSCFQTVQNEKTISAERLKKFQNDLCFIREEILNLMDKYRSSI